MKVDKVFFDFGDAIKYCKGGIKIARRGWNEKDMYVIYQKGYPDGVPANKQMAEALKVEEGTIVKINPYLQIKCVDGSISTWIPTINDILAEDWYAIVLD